MQGELTIGQMQGELTIGQMQGELRAPRQPTNRPPTTPTMCRRRPLRLVLFSEDQLELLVVRVSVPPRPPPAPQEKRYSPRPSTPCDNLLQDHQTPNSH